LSELLGNGLKREMKPRLITLCLVLMGISMFVRTAGAQMHSGQVFAHRSPGSTVAPRSAMGRRRFQARHNRPFFSRYGYGPNYYPGYYPGDYSDYSTEVGNGSTPDSEEEQSVRPAESAKPVAAKSPESLVVELRGDHWVRLTSTGPVAIAGVAGAETSGANSSVAAGSSGGAATELPAAVLVFRDGHREEAAKYTIVGKVISIKTDYWSSGVWVRKIPIAELDLPATLKENQQRGAKFTLPSRPSEVIFRP
jgi:hypothetical protein